VGAGRFTLKAVGTLVGAAGVVACLTVLYLCMRSVMAVGGACASGGPYVTHTPCPEGVGWMTPVSVLLGLAFLVPLGLANLGMPGPKLLLLAWPALFITLGYNFWDFGTNPPDGRSADVSWIVCAVLFFLMGGLPALALFSKGAFKSTFWNDGNLAGGTDGGDPGRPPKGVRPKARAVLKPAAPTFPDFVVRAARGPTPPAGPAAAPPDGPSTEIADALVKLAGLHSGGQLTDAEFAAAKAKLLGDVG
jgi:hypothetical protein